MKAGIDFIGVAAIPFIHDGNGKYLLGLRTENCKDEQGRWEPAGGGGVEVGESTEQAMKREALEEIGAELFNIEYLGHREAFRDSGGQKTHWLAFDYRAQVNPEEVKILEPEMCAELRWCAIDNLPEPLHSQFPIMLENYKGKL
jgi:8-oxo-dGTP diphosphatase